MSIQRRAVAAVLCSVALGMIGREAPAQTWAPGFYVEAVGGNFQNPVGIAFHDEHMFVVEKGGVVWHVENGLRSLTPVVDLSVEVLDNGDRGLLGVAADPQFSSNGYLYLLYIVDPDGDGVDTNQESFGRLTRYTLRPDFNGDLVADPTSRLVLIGDAWSNGIPSLHWSHSVGALRFGPDGALLLTTGDGAHYDAVDSGGRDPNGFGPGKFGPDEDIGAFRSQSMTSLAGKVLRVDPGTGLGLASNPFFTGDPADNTSRVFSLGLRNPYRFAVDPTRTATVLMIGDVGWDTWEELDTGNGGQNFGWPCREASLVQSSYEGVDPAGYCGDPTAFRAARWSYHHTQVRDRGFTGQSIAAVEYYEGTGYPAQYQGRLFFGDFSSDFIRTVRFVNGAPTEVEVIGQDVDRPVDLVTDPISSDLFYVALDAGEVRRLRYAGDLPPVAIASAAPAYGPTPLPVSLTGSGSFDPENGALSYDWDLGDGSTSSAPDVQVTYLQDQDYTATLTVLDGAGQPSTVSVKISAGNTPPAIVGLLSPPSGALFNVGDTVQLIGDASDPEDDANGIALKAKWVVDLVHDHHTHPSYLTLQGLTNSFVLDPHGPGTYWLVNFVVKDSRGLDTTASVPIYDAASPPRPHIVALSDTGPRIGESITATGHVEYPGLGDARLTWDFGDGTQQSMKAAHQEDRQVTHTYAGPGNYTLSLTAESPNGTATATQPVYVRPAEPGVAVWTSQAYQRWINARTQWTVASQLATTLRDAGHEAVIFSDQDQDDLAAWINAYLDDGVRDYLVLLDTVPAALYQGEDDGSLLEDWMEHGNGVLWSGATPFAHYVFPDGTWSSDGAAGTAADELLDTAGTNLVWGDGWQSLDPAATDLPSLPEFTATRAVIPDQLGPDWSLHTSFASNAGPPFISDACRLVHVAGGEYAQFLCVRDNSLPRADVFTEYFLSTLYANLPPGPGAAALVAPMDGASAVKTKPRLLWMPVNGADAYLVEVSADPSFGSLVFAASVVGENEAKVKPALQAGQAYWWRVTAQNRDGFAVSGAWSFVTE